MAEPTPAAPVVGAPDAGDGGSRRGLMLVGGGLAAALLLVVLMVAGGGRSGDDTALDPIDQVSTSETDEPSPEPTAGEATEVDCATLQSPSARELCEQGSEAGASPSPTPTLDPNSAEARGIPDGAKYVTLTSIEVQGGQYLVEYETEGFEPLIGGGVNHLHFWWQEAGVDTAITAATMGVDASPRGAWQVWPSEVRYDFTSGNYTPAGRPSGTTQLCASVATNDHRVEDPGTVDVTHHCIDLPDA